MTRENGAVRAEVANDGKQGRDLNVAPPFTGSGLAGLTERAGALGGQVEAAPWRTDSQAGFRLRVELPIQSSATAERE